MKRRKLRFRTNFACDLPADGASPLFSLNAQMKRSLASVSPSAEVGPALDDTAVRRSVEETFAVGCCDTSGIVSKGRTAGVTIGMMVASMDSGAAAANSEGL